jgi:hypothetical protein
MARKNIAIIVCASRIGNVLTTPIATSAAITGKISLSLKRHGGAFSVRPFYRLEAADTVFVQDHSVRNWA